MVNSSLYYASVVTVKIVFEFCFILKRLIRRYEFISDMHVIHCLGLTFFLLMPGDQVHEEVTDDWMFGGHVDILYSIHVEKRVDRRWREQTTIGGRRCRSITVGYMIVDDIVVVVRVGVSSPGVLDRRTQTLQQSVDHQWWIVRRRRWSGDGR